MLAVWLLGIIITMSLIDLIFVSSQTECHDAYDAACESTSIVESDNEEIECWGYFSCTRSSLTSEANGDIHCDAAYSCYEATSIQLTQTGGSNPTLHCLGLSSCSNVNDMLAAFGDIRCLAELSCFQSVLKVDESSDQVDCNGDRACASSRIEAPIVYVGGHMGAANAILKSNVDGSFFGMYGADSGYNTTIICQTGQTCTVECHTNACDDLQLMCQVNGTCTFTVDCRYSEMNDICPHGM